MPAGPDTEIAEDKLAIQILDQFRGMESEASNEKQTWQDIADFVMPRKSDITTTKTKGIAGWTDELYDEEAIFGNNTLASGMMDYVFSGRWLETEDPRGDDAPQRAKDWYKKTGEITLRLLNQTNFYLEIHESLLDWGGFGTTHVHCEPDDEDALFFSKEDVGCFYVSENKKRLCDTIFRKREWTARQAAEYFGKETLGPELSKAYESQEAGDRLKTWTFIHAVYPRPRHEREPGRIDGRNMPIASVYVCKEEKRVYRNSGYQEAPGGTARFLRWGKTPYGYCPSHSVIATIRQANTIERDLDALGEIAAFPRILTPVGMKGDVDLRAAGSTSFDPNNPSAKPEEWATSGRYDIGMDRADRKRDKIRRAYFVDLFQLLTNPDELKRDKTAYEVSQMLSEKISRISPAFQRYQVEFIRPLFNCLWNNLLRGGHFPAVPDEVIVRNEGGEFIESPRPVLVGRLAQAIRAIENNDLIEWLNILLPIIQISPEFAKAAIAELNPERIIRGTGDNKGIASKFFNTEDEKKAILERMEQMEQAQQGLAAAQQASETVKNLKDAPWTQMRSVA